MKHDWSVKKGIAVLLTTAVVWSLSACSATKAGTTAAGGQDSATKAAETTPYGKYSETVTYTLGKNTPGSPRFPSGDTYENNAYSRYLKDTLNVQNKDAFEANGDAYTQKVSMAIASGNIPDIMDVNATTLRQLVDNDMIADLSSVYKTTTTDTIKKDYNSYGSRALSQATFNGKLMALPSTQCDNEPTMLWLRKDWLDKLGLSAPKTLEDVENILTQFVQKDPGNNGAGKTVGIVCPTTIGGAYASLYQMDMVLALYKAFPDQWLKENGKVVYGSTTPEMKNGLAKLADWYKRGLIDPQMAVRKGDDLISLIVNGQCGAFFGPWWAPDYPLNDAKKLNGKADWQPYIVPTNSDGSITTYTQNVDSDFFVVRKGFKHPEVLTKVASVINDKLAYQDYNNGGIASYEANGVDSGTDPINILINNRSATTDMYKNIQLALNGKKDPDSLAGDKANYLKAKAYLADPQKAAADDWSGYMSRVVSTGLMTKVKVNGVDPVFFGQTDSMKLKWSSLDKLQQEDFLKIVTGQEPVSYFDTFVANWKSMGGDQITKEVEKAISGK